MAQDSFNVERATNGLVLALMLAALVFLIIMAFRIVRDVNERQAAQEESPQRTSHRVLPRPNPPGPRAHPLLRAPSSSPPFTA